MSIIMPLTAGGWVAMILGVVTILGLLGGLVIKLGKQHIDSRINKTMEFTVRKAVLDGVERVTIRLDAMQLELTAQGGELGRVRDIEEIIQNGLAARQERIEVKVDKIIDHLMWNGDERRVEG